MFVMCVIFVFLTRGCYQGNYMVNGRALDAGAIVGAVSKVTFHLIAVAVMLIAALLSMRVFRRDRDEGMQSSILSKPITRRQYVMGKILGLWALSTLLHVHPARHSIPDCLRHAEGSHARIPCRIAALLFQSALCGCCRASFVAPDAGYRCFPLCCGHRCRRSGNRLGICVKPQPDGDCDDPAIGAIPLCWGKLSTMYGRSFQGRNILRPRSSAARDFTDSAPYILSSMCFFTALLSARHCSGVSEMRR